jgi:hypothetical protein
MDFSKTHRPVFSKPQTNFQKPKGKTHPGDSFIQLSLDAEKTVPLLQQ